MTSSEVVEIRENLLKIAEKEIERRRIFKQDLENKWRDLQSKCLHPEILTEWDFSENKPWRQCSDCEKVFQ